MDTFLRRVLDRARQLGLPWWEHLALVLALALLSVAGEAAWGEIRQIEWKVEPAPQPVSDGGTAADRDLPPAQPDLTPREDLDAGGAG